MGTRKLAPREKNRVVDNNFSSHGVRGTKLADLDIPPEKMGANTGNTAFLIGEEGGGNFH